MSRWWLALLAGCPKAERPAFSTAYVQCPSHSLGVDLVRSGRGEYSGHGRHHYEDSTYARCVWSDGALTCDGTWSFTGTSSSLRIESRPDGMVALVASPGGGVDEYACYATDAGLGGCVFNPQHPGCEAVRR